MPMPPEEWRLIPGFSRYMVSSRGRIRSTARSVYRVCVGKRRDLFLQDLMMKVSPYRPGIPGVRNAKAATIGLKRDDGCKSTVQVSHAVLTAFVSPRPVGKEACHGDGDANNNAVENLRWDTHKANMADMLRHGTFVMPKKGDGHWKAKLTSAKAADIRNQRFEGVSERNLAKFYGVCDGTITHIVTRRTWKDAGGAHAA